MSDTSFDGGPAFPTLERGGQGLELTSTGMSQRALIAAILMHSELTTCGVPGEAADALVAASIDSGLDVDDQMARNAVDCADALLRALAAPLPPRLSHEEQSKLRAHDKLLEILRDVHHSGAVNSLPPNQRDAITALFVVDLDDEIPF
ncbi:hypothetical protein [Ramlibacter sp.]|uniref:hypothetical protein n=1 Tax=Ramlibacter sp. TaxID=1917967 RepID=UPI003D0A3E32